ncbi:hypothetical protein HZP91_15320 [Elizabethkingia anophelis]|nr:hypothetical protein [Elizabethkingia anophelis]
MEGKAKEAFKKFCYENDYALFTEHKKYKDLAMFNNALKIEWLDSVNLFIEVYTTWESYNKVKQFSFKIVDENDKILCDKWLSPYFNSRQEATEAAIKKAVEIFNERE